MTISGRTPNEVETKSDRYSLIWMVMTPEVYNAVVEQAELEDEADYGRL